MQSKIVKEIINKYPVTKDKSLHNLLMYLEARLELLKYWRDYK